MKEIRLHNGMVSLVDDEDFVFLNQFKWSVSKYGKTYYARCIIYLGGGRKNPRYLNIFMHRLILNAPKGIEVDHIDHDGLNNQRSNIRLCSKQQNNCNRVSKGKYLGVRFHLGGFETHISVGNKFKYLGRFKTSEEAALAYDVAAKEIHKEFANLNFKENVN